MSNNCFLIFVGSLTSTRELRGLEMTKCSNMISSCIQIYLFIQAAYWFANKTTYLHHPDKLETTLFVLISIFMYIYTFHGGMSIPVWVISTIELQVCTL